MHMYLPKPQTGQARLFLWRTLIYYVSFLNEIGFERFGIMKIGPIFR